MDGYYVQNVYGGNENIIEITLRSNEGLASKLKEGFVQALHSRLGERSPYHGLPDNIVEMIFASSNLKGHVHSKTFITRSQGDFNELLLMIVNYETRKMDEIFADTNPADTEHQELKFELITGNDLSKISNAIRNEFRSYIDRNDDDDGSIVLRFGNKNPSNITFTFVDDSGLSVLADFFMGSLPRREVFFKEDSILYFLACIRRLL